MKIDHRQFFLRLEGARRDDEKWPRLHHVQHMMDHWAIDDHGCYYVDRGEPEQPEWPPCVEPGWRELYRGMGFYESERWVMQ